MLVYLILFFLITILPILWSNYIFNKYDKIIHDMPYSGYEFGKLLINEFKLKGVLIESSSKGDYYDLDHKKVKVNETRLKRKSLTSISIICHEIGHAIQHSQNYPPLSKRNELIKNTEWLTKISSALIYFGFPAIFASGSLSLVKICLAIIFISLLIGFIIHLVTLEVEFDASFKKAYPILKRKLPEIYHKSCYSILRAAAFTYLIGVFKNIISLRVIWNLISKYRF